MTLANWSDYYRDKSVLVTGAGGFIGRHLARALGDTGATVEVTRHDSLDVADAAAVSKLVANASYDLVFNLAARAAGDRNLEQMAGQASVTLGGAINLATAILQKGSGRLIQIGSSEEYGAANVPFFENQALAPVSPYSAAKASASQFLLMAQISFGLNVSVARPSVVFGPGQKSGMVIPYLFDCYTKKTPAQISPGDQTRDFLYIDDCVEALLILGARPDLSGECFNFGSGEEVKLKDVAGEIARLCEYDGDLGLGSRPYRNAEVMRHKESVAKALDKLGWQAKVDLKEGLSRTHGWWQNLSGDDHGKK